MRMSRAGWWMLGALLPSMLLACGALLARGVAAPGTILALKLTARWAYCFFWPAYTGGALASFFGPRFAPLAKSGRELGLAFVAAMVPHTALIAWVFHILPEPPMPPVKVAFFVVALAFAYVLALLSVPAIAARLDASRLRWMRAIAVEYIALAFLRDFLRSPIHQAPLEMLAYVPFAALALGAAFLRLCYWFTRFRPPHREVS
jgi:hypothetical protein